MKDSLRKKILERDDGICWHCGTTEGVQVHHRINRGMGGSRLLDRPCNLVVICAEYNFLMEQNFVDARAARILGIKLSRHAFPLNEPIRDYNGQWYLLDDFNRKHEVENIDEFGEDG